MGSTLESMRILNNAVIALFRKIPIECLQFFALMATMPPMTSKAIALAEKKMNMALDDIIKMSRKSSSYNARKPRASNKSERFPPCNASQGNSSKVWKYMDCRSSLRQGVLAKRRSNFQGNQFPLMAEAARNAAVAPIRNWPLSRNRVVNWNKPRVIAPRNASKNGFIQKVNTMPWRRPQTLKLVERMKNMQQEMEQLKWRMKNMQQQIAREENGRRHQWQGRGRRAASAASFRLFGGSNTTTCNSVHFT